MRLVAQRPLAVAVVFEETLTVGTAILIKTETMTRRDKRPRQTIASTATASEATIVQVAFPAPVTVVMEIAVQLPLPTGP